MSKLSSVMSARQVCFLSVDAPSLHCFAHSKFALFNLLGFALGVLVDVFVVLSKMVGCILTSKTGISWCHL